MTLSRNARRAIAKHGETLARKAYKLHHVDGEGGRTVGIYLGLTTNQADALINAGRELVDTYNAEQAAPAPQAYDRKTGELY